MIWPWIVLGVLVVALAVMGVVGSRLPVGHRARRSVHLPASPETIFGALADVEATPSWRRDLRSVELLGDVEGRQRFREIGKHGVITYEVVECRAPERRVVRIVDESLPFGGSWTFELAAEQGGTRLTLTEDGEVRNALFRFLARYVFGHAKTLDELLGDLREHLDLGAATEPRQ